MNRKRARSTPVPVVWIDAPKFVSRTGLVYIADQFVGCMRGKWMLPAAFSAVDGFADGKLHGAMRGANEESEIKKYF